MPSTPPEVRRLEGALSDLWRRGTVGRLHTALITAAGVDVDHAGYLVLRRIGADTPIRVTDLAAVFGVEPSTISRHVRSLTQRGWVRKVADPSDGRATLLEPTPDGQRIIERVEEERLRTLTAVLGSWGLADRKEFASLMERFATSLADHLDPERTPE